MKSKTELQLEFFNPDGSPSAHIRIMNRKSCLVAFWNVFSRNTEWSRVVGSGNFDKFCKSEGRFAPNRFESAMTEEISRIQFLFYDYEFRAFSDICKKKAESLSLVCARKHFTAASACGRFYAWQVALELSSLYIRSYRVLQV
jgi:hypothetical protein